jgi:hypothetical protein
MIFPIPPLSDKSKDTAVKESDVPGTIIKEQPYENRVVPSDGLMLEEDQFVDDIGRWFRFEVEFEDLIKIRR